VAPENRPRKRKEEKNKMANFEIKDGDFALFLNDKGGVSKRPDWRGYVQIDGVKYDVAAWNKTSGNGKPYIGGQVKKAEEKQQ